MTSPNQVRLVMLIELPMLQAYFGVSMGLKVLLLGSAAVCLGYDIAVA